jgi:hypothetical protein
MLTGLVYRQVSGDESPARGAAPQHWWVYYGQSVRLRLYLAAFLSPCR